MLDTPAKVEKHRFAWLAEAWGCTYVNLEVHKVKQGKTEVHKEPTLAERIAEARNAYGDAQKELDKMGAQSRTQKWANERKWHFIEGAVSWLKGETTAELGSAVDATDIPPAKQALEAKVASRMRWENVKQMVKVEQEKRQAEKIKVLKRDAVEKQQQAAAIELLASMLIEATYAVLPDVQWRNKGLVDLKWNLGIVPSDGDGVIEECIEYEINEIPKEGPDRVIEQSPVPSPTKGRASKEEDDEKPKVAVAAAAVDGEEAGEEESQPKPKPWANPEEWEKQQQEWLKAPATSGGGATILPKNTKPPEEYLQVALALSIRPNHKGELLGARHPQDPKNGLEQVCYYCAGGRGGPHHPLSDMHMMCDCPLRVQHGEREFPQEALDRVTNALAAEAQILNRAIQEQAANAIEAKLSKGLIPVGWRRFVRLNRTAEASHLAEQWRRRV